MKKTQRTKAKSKSATPARKAATRSLESRKADAVKGGGAPLKWTKGGGSSVG